MKFINKSWILIPGLVLATASCTDLDTQPEGGNSTSDQKQEIAEAIPERVAADLSGIVCMVKIIHVMTTSVIRQLVCRWI